MNSVSDVIEIMFDKSEAQKVEMSSYKPQAGYYSVVIDDVEVKTSKNNKPYLDIAATATDAQADVAFKTFGTVWLTDGAKIRYGRFLSSMGLDLTARQYKPNDFMNQKAVAAIFRGDSKYLRMQDFHRNHDVVLGPDPGLEPPAQVNADKKSPSNFGEDTPF